MNEFAHRFAACKLIHFFEDYESPERAYLLLILFFWHMFGKMH